jgi:hypothetical protein
MQVKHGDRTLIEARAVAEPAEDVITDDYYARLAQIRLSREATDLRVASPVPTEVIVDGTDVGRLVECAIRHPSHLMRNMVLSAIWNHPETFRQIFEFGLRAPPAYQEIRDIVAEALAQHAAATEAPTAPAGENSAGEKPLLPRMPLPAHLQNRARK